jgi:catechol 2,3-dioxygenase-like lactoylglutathione lyase family enzyme
MPGSFLELSVWSRDIAASVAFWERLGFRHGRVGDVWAHRYAVLSDGRLVLGLHEYSFDSPSLTWVRPGLAEAIPGLQALGISFDFAKTGDDQFNEAGFRDPAGQVVTLLEARTWSASFEPGAAGTALGHFAEYRYPAKDPAATVAFWESLGLVADVSSHGPRAVAGGINLAPSASAAAPELVFEVGETDAAAAALAELGIAVETAGDALLLRAPDGLLIRVERV